MYKGHSLSVERGEGISQGMKRERNSEGHSRTGGPRARDKSGRGKREGSERAKGTHILESMGAEISQDTKINSASERVLTSWIA
jgi:hypothetical protein